MSEGAARKWYALAVHVRQEKAAAAAIDKLGVEVFLPCRMSRRVWSDRIQNVQVALFPGYIFIRTHLTPARRVQLLRVQQVIDLVGARSSTPELAQSIPDHQVDSLRLLVSEASGLDPVEGLVRGSEVVVAIGPLKGAHGVVLHQRRRRRFVVQIELLGRGVSTELDADVLVRAADG